MNNTLELKAVIAVVQRSQTQAYEYQIKPGEWIDVKDKEHLLKLEGLGFIVRRKKK